MTGNKKNRMHPLHTPKLVWALAAFLIVAFFLPNAKTEAAAGIRYLKLGTTYQDADITGDGKNDKVCLKGVISGKKYNKVNVFINGKLNTTIETPKAYTSYGGGVSAWLITLANGKPFLYVDAYKKDKNGWSEQVSRGMYQYQNKKLRKIIDFYDFESSYGTPGVQAAGAVSVNGNTVKIRCALEAYSGPYFSFYVTYTYQAGTLKQAANTIKLNRDHAVTTDQKLTVYKKAGSTAKTAFTVKKNKKVSIDRVWIKNGKLWLKVKANGKTGWIPESKEPYADDQRPFVETPYAEIF